MQEKVLDRVNESKAGMGFQWKLLLKNSFTVIAAITVLVAVIKEKMHSYMEIRIVR